ncbi:maleylacetate reductase [Streptosporangium sp. NPDC051023]|uniref:maleylacetate reductase n=1 Tax=Streptosporangium sp. NPDC051023 TaxID=3155410 RepID=UPI0034506D46
MAEPFVHEQGASRVVFGTGRLASAAAEVERLGGLRVMLIADRHSARHAETVALALGDRLCGRIEETATHVPAALADAATEQAIQIRADLLVCVGGGSATGLAKIVALRTGLRILAVPTTYAGSEMTPIWGVTGDGRKRTGRDPVVQPVTVVYDPALTLDLPARLSAQSGMNALAHLVEALYAPQVSPLVATAAVEGVTVLADALPKVVADPLDLAARESALRGAWLAGWVLGLAPMGLHHKICHILGGAHGLPHAATHAAVLPYVAAYNGAYLHRLDGVLREAATGLWDLRESIGASGGLADLGLDGNALGEVAELVTAERPANPRAVDADGVRRILLAAFEGARP